MGPPAIAPALGGRSAGGSRRARLRGRHESKMRLACASSGGTGNLVTGAKTARLENCPRQHGRHGPAAGLLQVVLELAGAARVAEVMQRLPLDLADPLAGDVELLADLLKRAGAAVLQPEAQLEHSALTAGQRVEHGCNLLPEKLVRRGLGRGQRGAVLDLSLIHI